MNIHELRPKVGDTVEKITINQGTINLLVLKPFHSDRIGYIRTAVRHQLTIRAGVPHRNDLLQDLRPQPAAAPPPRSGSRANSRTKAQDPGARTCSIVTDVPPELALATIDSIVVFGARHANARQRPHRRAGSGDRKSSPKETRPNECTT